MTDMVVWEGERSGLVGFGHDFPGSSLSIRDLPGGRAREIEPAALHRLGVDTLHHSRPEETALDLGVRAGQRALGDARIGPSEVDLVVVANSSQRWYVPELGPRLARRMGAAAALGFDVCGACAGS